MPTTALVKTAQSPALARVSSQLALMDKLMAKPKEPFLIPYRKGDKWGFCDRNKKIVIDCVYGFISDQSSGFWIAKTGHNEEYLINQKGEIINRTDYKGRIFDAPLQWISYISQEGLYCIKEYDKYGCIDHRGNYIIPPISDEKIQIKESMAYIVNNSRTASVFVSIEGHVGFKIKNWGNFWHAGCFSEGVAAFGINEGVEKIGFLDLEGQVVIPPVYDIPDDPDAPFWYDDSRYTFINGLCAVCANNKWGAINHKNETIIPFRYEQLWVEPKGLVLAIENEKLDIFEYYNNLGQVLNLPLQPDFLNAYDSEFITGIKDEKWGYMDRQFNVIIEPQYEYANRFAQELAAVQKNDLWGYINHQNDVIISFQFTRASRFSNGLAAVKSGDKWGYIDRKGKLVVDFKYSGINDYSESGLARVHVDGKTAGYIDRMGTEYWEG